MTLLSAETSTPVASQLLQLIARLDDVLPTAKAEHPSAQATLSPAEFDSLIASW